MSDGRHHGTWPLLDNPIGPGWAVSGGHRHLRFSPQTERLPSDERDFRCGTFAAHGAVGEDHVTASPQIRDTSVSGGQGTDNAEADGSIPSSPTKDLMKGHFWSREYKHFAC